MSNTCGILSLYFFSFSLRSFCLSKVLILSIHLFICLYPLSISLLHNLSQLSWNALFEEQMWQRHKACANGSCFILKTQDVLIYDLNKPVDLILS